MAVRELVLECPCTGLHLGGAGEIKSIERGDGRPPGPHSLQDRLVLRRQDRQLRLELPETAFVATVGQETQWGDSGQHFLHRVAG
jgi:hypothetical protein